MFRARHNELLSIAHFHGDHINDPNIIFHAVEAWKYAGVSLSPSFCDFFLHLTCQEEGYSDHNIHRVHVKEPDLEDWLAGSVSRSSDLELEGGLRVL